MKGARNIVRKVHGEASTAVSVLIPGGCGRGADAVGHTVRYGFDPTLKK